MSAVDNVGIGADAGPSSASHCAITDTCSGDACGCSDQMTSSARSGCSSAPGAWRFRLFCWMCTRRVLGAISWSDGCHHARVPEFRVCTDRMCRNRGQCIGCWVFGEAGVGMGLGGVLWFASGRCSVAKTAQLKKCRCVPIRVPSPSSRVLWRRTR